MRNGDFIVVLDVLRNSVKIWIAYLKSTISLPRWAEAPRLSNPELKAVFWGLSQLAIRLDEVWNTLHKSERLSRDPCLRKLFL